MNPKASGIREEDKGLGIAGSCLRAPGGKVEKPSPADLGRVKELQGILEGEGWNRCMERWPWLGDGVSISELESAKYSPHMSQNFSDAPFREVKNALQDWRRISQFTAQPPHLTVWGLWERGCCKVDGGSTRAHTCESWRNHGERCTWDAQKPSELCPLKCSRHQARGVNGPAGAELQW